MGYVGDQVAAHLILLFTCVGHLVERLGEFLDLAEAAHVTGPRAEFAATPGPRRLDQAVHWRRDPARQEQRDDQRDHSGDPRGADPGRPASRLEPGDGLA